MSLLSLQGSGFNGGLYIMLYLYNHLLRVVTGLLIKIQYLKLLKIKVTAKVPDGVDSLDIKGC